VQVPPPAAYFEPINWHRPHSMNSVIGTGQASRLNRDHSGSFGSKSYAREELVAEMAGAFVCASLGIVPTVRHADYIGSWLEVLREDNRAVVRAASADRRPPISCSPFCRLRSIPSLRATRRPRDASARRFSVRFSWCGASSESERTLACL